MARNTKGWLDVASVHYCPAEKGPTLCGVPRKRLPEKARTHDTTKVTCKQCRQGIESVERASMRETASLLKEVLASVGITALIQIDDTDTVVTFALESHVLRLASIVNRTNALAQTIVAYKDDAHE